MMRAINEPIAADLLEDLQRGRLSQTCKPCAITEAAGYSTGRPGAGRHRQASPVQGVAGLGTLRRSPRGFPKQTAIFQGRI